MNIIALLMAIGLCILWLTAGLLLLPLAVLGWVVKSMQRGLGWLINLGGSMSKIDIFNLLAAIWLAPRVSPWLGTAIGLSYVVVSSALLFGWWK